MLLFDVQIGRARSRSSSLLLLLEIEQRLVGDLVELVHDVSSSDKTRRPLGARLEVYHPPRHRQAARRTPPSTSMSSAGSRGPRGPHHAMIGGAEAGRVRLARGGLARHECDPEHVGRTRRRPPPRSRPCPDAARARRGAWRSRAPATPSPGRRAGRPRTPRRCRATRRTSRAAARCRLSRPEREPDSFIASSERSAVVACR